MKLGKASSRKMWSQPLADLVAPCLTPALARYGFGEADLLLFWPEIVGERLARRCEPMRMLWAARTPARGMLEPATLVVQVEGAFAIELQHQAELVMERVNTHCGWRCVGRLALRQGPVSGRRAARAPVQPPDQAAVERARVAVEPIHDHGLREALARLGGRVLSGPVSR